ncbi:hypothetical protein BGZ94_002079 [Podila epigama]|nr:hypothetical protein BGZ94_002079 [Podila epigama]
MSLSAPIDAAPQPFVFASADRVVFRAIPQTLAPTNKKVTLSLRRTPSSAPSSPIAPQISSTPVPATTQSPNTHHQTNIAISSLDLALPAKVIVTPPVNTKVSQEPLSQTSASTPTPTLTFTPASETSTKTMKPAIFLKNGLPLKSAMKSPLPNNDTGSLNALRPSTIRSHSSPSFMVTPKYVHFNTDLEHVRLFLQGEMPSCVSERETIVDGRQDTCSTSSIQLTFSNWSPVAPSAVQPVDLDSGAAPLRVEKVALSDDQSDLKGKVLIQNIAYHKHVSVRYTTDFWQTQSEVNAEFEESVLGTPLDRFAFSIPLGMEKSAVEKSFCFAVRYQVIGREFWDSNNGMNYQVECKRVVVAPSVPLSKNLNKQMNNVLLASDVGKPTLKKKQGASRYDLSTSLSAAYNRQSTSFKNPTPIAVSQSAYRPSEYITPVQSPPSYHTQSLYASSPKFMSSYMSAVSPPEHIHLGFEPLSLYHSASKRGSRPPWASREIESTRSLASTAPMAIPVPHGNNGSRPSVGSSSYYDLVDRYCFYESSPHSSPYSSYPNSPPATCIRG